MKLSGIGSLQGIGSVKSTSAPSEAGRLAKSSSATTVSMSSDAAWIESLRAESQKLGPIRSEVVAETRARSHEADNSSLRILIRMWSRAIPPQFFNADLTSNRQSTQI